MSISPWTSLTRPSAWAITIFLSRERRGESHTVVLKKEANYGSLNPCVFPFCDLRVPMALSQEVVDIRLRHRGGDSLFVYRDKSPEITAPKYTSEPFRPLVRGKDAHAEKTMLRNSRAAANAPAIPPKTIHLLTGRAKRVRLASRSKEGEQGPSEIRPPEPNRGGDQVPPPQVKWLSLRSFYILRANNDYMVSS